MTPGDVFRVAFEVGGAVEPITRQVLGIGPNGGSVLFTSYDEDMRLHSPPIYHDVPLKEKDDQGALLPAVSLLVGGGFGFVFAYRVALGRNTERLILMNGIHRVYELAKAGYQSVPVAVCDVQPLEVPDPLIDLPKQLLLDPEADPPVITDFLNEAAVLELDFYRVLRTVRLNWGFEQYATVLR
jgi:hypothetical protein